MGNKRTDDYLAGCIRGRLMLLRQDIQAARDAGLTVKIPELVHLYLDGGTASGAPGDWIISREYTSSESV